MVTTDNVMMLEVKAIVTFTAKNSVFSPDFLVWKFCVKAQFPHSFGRIPMLSNKIEIKTDKRK